MILNSSLTWTILIAFGLIFGIGIFFLLARVFKLTNPKIILLLVVLPPIVAVIATESTATDFDVVHKDMSISKYLVWGTGTYTSATGKTVTIQKQPGKRIFIMNECEVPLVIEPINYGTSFYFGTENMEMISPGNCGASMYSPDYFPLESPPDQVSVDQSSSGVTKYWLRIAKGDEQNNSENSSDTISN